MQHEPEDHRLLRASVADFVAAENPPARLRGMRELPDGFDRARFRQMAGFGWTRLDAPEDDVLGETAGLGLGYAELAVLHEELGRGAMPEPFATAGLAAATLAAGNNAPLKERWLPALWSGEAVATLAWQGAEGAHAAMDSGCVVAQSSDGYRLSGRSVFVPLAGTADLLLVTARMQERANRLALFALPPGTRGVRVDMRRAADYTPVGSMTFEDVRLPADASVSGAGDCAPLIDRLLDRARLAASAELVGSMRAALDLTLGYLRTREQFGRPIGSFQALQHQAVNLYMQLELSRAAVAQAAQALDTGAQGAAATVASCKARCSDAGVWLGGRAVHLHGAIGVTEEYQLGLFLRRMHFLAAWLGNGNAMRRRYRALVPELATAEPAPEAA